MLSLSIFVALSGIIYPKIYFLRGKILGPEEGQMQRRTGMNLG